MNESQNSRKGSVNDKNDKQRNETKPAAITYSIKQPKLNIGNEYSKRI